MLSLSLVLNKMSRLNEEEIIKVSQFKTVLNFENRSGMVIFSYPTIESSNHLGSRCEFLV